jgi:hypothetical protein
MARPKGAWSEKKFRDALNLAVSEEGAGGVRKIRLIADKLVEAALNGEVQAIKEVGDRLDGKPAQAVVGDDDAPAIRMIAEVRRVIVDPKAQ